MKLIESNWVKEHSSGIIAVCFNLANKGVFFHRYDDTKYYAWVETEGDKITIDEDIEIESFKKEGVKYVVSEQREKFYIVHILIFKKFF